MEWLPNHSFGICSTPRVTGREPLWTQAGLARDVEAGRYCLPHSATGGRETIVTSPVEAEPQYVMRLSGPGWAHLAAAMFTAAFFLLLTVKAVALASICGVLAVASIIVWMWGSDPAPTEPVDIGGGIVLPTYASGTLSHSWWAMVILTLVAAALYLSYVFGYLYLWTVSPQHWPGNAALPSPEAAAVPTMLLVASGLLLLGAKIVLGRPAVSRARFSILIALGIVALLAGFALDGWSHWRSGLRPQASGYAAMVYANVALQLQIAGRLTVVRRMVFDNLLLFWTYAIGQGLFGLLLTHGFLARASMSLDALSILAVLLVAVSGLALPACR